jgi:MFS transporter, PAT family, beta-lactamase induction signal transducer AmpG
MNHSNISWSRTVVDWLASFKVYAQPPVARMLALGFGAGLPLLLVLGTLSFWLREAGIDRKTIGFLSWIGLAYGFKWVWAPLVDRLPIPLLTQWFGQRRSWMLLAQAGIVAGLLGMAATDPKSHLDVMVYCAIFVAFCSATQDIALDALRIESADETLQAALSAAYQTGYRIAMIWAGAGVLWVAGFADNGGAACAPSTAKTVYNFSSWTIAYTVMAASMVVGILAVCFSKEPPTATQSSATKNVLQWLQDALVAPFMAFMNRFGWQQAAVILALIATYRISDVVMGIMANPFYVDTGFNKCDVANVTKVYGVVMTLVGAALGGVMALRWGVMRVMMIGAVLSALTNVLFAWLAVIGNHYWALVGVISADNLASGIASAAFIAYMSGLTSRGYSATQYALFSSLMLLLPKFIAGFSGVFVNEHGYPTFFIATALLGVPVLALVWWAQRLGKTVERCMKNQL